MRTMLGAAVFLCALAVAAPAFAQTLGVVEDRPGVVAGEAHRRIVRAVFQNDGHGWQALPATGSPANAHWTVAFDGRALGAISARLDPSLNMNADAGALAVVAPETAPKIGTPSSDFAGWYDEPVLRPLIAVSEPHVADPEHWRPAILSQAQNAALRAAFRHRFSHVQNCPTDAAPERAWNYRDADIAIAKAYRSTADWRIAQVQLGPYKCDGPSDQEPGFSSQTFAIAPNGAVTLLGEGLMLVDAGDYDGDGKSELVFQISSYNRGGYEIFSDAFAHHAAFEFSYH